MNLRRRRRVAVLATAAGVGLLLFLALQLDRVEPASRSAAVDGAGGAAPPGSMDAGVERATDEREPRLAFADPAAVEVDSDALIARSSLRGTEADGEIVLQPNGRLRIDPELRRRLDYYLTLIGELSLDEIRALLHDDIVRAQGKTVADLVAALFDRYVGMRRAMAGADLPEDALARLERMRELRRAWLGDAADQLFADEHDYDAYTAERLAVRSADDLSAADQADLLDELAASRPLSEQRQRTSTLSALAAAQQTEMFDAERIDAATRHSERSALWGREAADRLAALDAQRQQWQQRLQTYAAARQRLLSDRGLSSAARDRALADLLSGFSPEEQARLRSLAAVGALPDGG